jgi:putative oxidoreductase
MTKLMTACDTEKTSGCPFGKCTKHLAQNADLLLRLVLGVIFVAHGAQKAFGWFDGPGIENFSKFMVELNLPFPVLNAYLAAYTELIGGLLLILGMYTRFAALGIAGTMVVAITMVHWSGGLFAANNGFEYPLTIFAACVTLMGIGAGPLSVDGVWKGLNQKVKDTVSMD